MHNLKRVLHLSPTDIRYDSRILKELKSIEQLENYNLLAYGINDNEGHQYEIDPISYIQSFHFFTKKLYLLPRFLRLILFLLEAILRLPIPAIRYRPHIIHCHDTLFLPIALLIKLFCNSILIYDAHELESNKGGQGKFLSKSTLLIEKLSWKRIDLLISVSPSIINWYQNNLGSKENLLILNSPQLESVNEVCVSNNYLRERYNIPEYCKIFIYVGIIADGRGIDLCLNVFQSSEINSHIVFLGYGKDVKKVQEASLNFDNIHFHPSVKHDEVLGIAKSADIGLVMIEEASLSDYYCLPNKLFEFAFSNLYILASDFPDMKKIIKEYDLGTCSSLNFKEFKQKISEIEAQKLYPSTKSLDSLNWEFQSKKIVDYYNNIK